jgi:hypothetical protein
MRTLATITGVALLSISIALADDGGRNNNNNNPNSGNGQFQSAMAGSTPGMNIGGVASGALPWVIGEGEAFLSASGRLQVQVSGLLIADVSGVPSAVAGTTGPVQMVAASVVCGGSGGTVAANTAGTLFFSGGSAQIQEQVTMPSVCVGPVVLLRVFNSTALPGAQLGPFIAATGLNAFTPGQQGNGQENNGGDGHGDH